MSERDDGAFRFDHIPGADLARRSSVDPVVRRPPRRHRTIQVIVPPIDPMPQEPVSRRRGRDRPPDLNMASNLARAWRGTWVSLWRVTRWCVPAAALVWLLVSAWAGLVWGTVAAAVPLAVIVVWMRLVLRQARAHVRGEAGPPPGWLGR